MQKILKSFLVIVLCMQSIITPMSAAYNQYHPTPIVPYQTTNPGSEPAVLGILVGGIGLCVSLYVVISEWLNNKTEKKNIRLYTEMFKNLGYDDAQANAYAKIAVINSGGFNAVLDFIEREKEVCRRQ